MRGVNRQVFTIVKIHDQREITGPRRTIKILSENEASDDLNFLRQSRQVFQGLLALLGIAAVLPTMDMTLHKAGQISKAVSLAPDPLPFGSAG